MRTYRAIQKGFDGVTIREPGETFQFEGKPGSWMELAEEVKAEAKPGKPGKQKPEQLEPQKSASDQEVI